MIVGSQKANIPGNLQGLRTLREGVIDHWVYFGTFTTNGGIHAAHFRLDTGELRAIGMVASIEKPSFLAIGPGSRALYVVSEVRNWNGLDGGAIAA